MTKRGKRKNTEMGLLKTLVVVGSVAATLAGTRLLAVRETVGETAVSQPAQIIIERAAMTPLPMPPQVGGDDQAIVLDLAPVPQALTPHINPVRVQPVARTKTS